jgi:triosephosphate isomerase
VQKEFTLENYPKGDATWTFVDQKSKLVSKGYVPAIHDFTIVSDRFEDITAKVLSNTAQSYLLVMYDVNKTSVDGAKRAEEIYLKYKNSVTQFYALTASSDEDIAKFRKTTGVTFPFCKTDPTTLKTIIRANPGLVLIQNGTIQGKWNWRDF